MSGNNLLTIIEVTIVFVIVSLFWILFVLIPQQAAEEEKFTLECLQNGGVPSRFETRTGKNSQSERLCIKKESVVEISSLQH